MELNKKAFFFTSMALIILTVLMLTLKPSLTTFDMDRMPTLENRIISINEYVRELNNDYIPKAITVSTRSALFHYSNYLIEENKFLNENEMKHKLYYLIVQGNISEGTILNNHSLINLLNNITVLVNESLKVETEIKMGSFESFNIFQDNTTGPWKIAVNLSLNYTITSELALWNITNQNYNVQIYLDNLPDPYFTINSNGTKRNITYYEEIVWDYETFKIFYNKKYYVWSNISPSYLSRLTNDTSPSNNTGIHTILLKGEDQKNIGELNGYNNISFIDFCYFTNGCNGLYKINNISSDYVDESNLSYPFRIDTYHATFYNILGESINLNE
jgi:hypothetical protein